MQTEITTNGIAQKEQSTPAMHAQKPPFNVYENESEFYLLCELPGVTAESLEITVEQNTLYLSGRRGDHADLGYEREFVMGPGIDVDSIDAELKDGLLHIHVKKSDALKPKRIPVRSS